MFVFFANLMKCFFVSFCCYREVCFLIVENSEPLGRNCLVRSIARVGYMSRPFSMSKDIQLLDWTRRLDRACTRILVANAPLFLSNGGVRKEGRMDGRTNGRTVGPDGRGTYEGYGGTFTQNGHHRHRQLFTIRVLLSTLASSLPLLPPHS